MSRLRPRREQFQPKEICLGKYISCWDSRKSDAPELMSQGASDPLAGLSRLEVYTDSASSPKQRKKRGVFLFSSPCTFEDFFGLLSGRKPLTGKLQRHQSNF